MVCIAMRPKEEHKIGAHTDVWILADLRCDYPTEDNEPKDWKETVVAGIGYFFAGKAPKRPLTESWSAAVKNGKTGGVGSKKGSVESWPTKCEYTEDAQKKGWIKDG